MLNLFRLVIVTLYIIATNFNVTNAPSCNFTESLLTFHKVRKILPAAPLMGGHVLLSSTDRCENQKLIRDLSNRTFCEYAEFFICCSWWSVGLNSKLAHLYLFWNRHHLESY